MEQPGKTVLTALHVVVGGRVQGVGFRYSCYTLARRLGLGGWVRNTPDGDVEVWLEGPAGERLDTMLEWLRQGPPSARVDRFRCDSVQPANASREFSIVP
jgi:acylphosphatase